jgi:hypothetical protein
MERVVWRETTCLRNLADNRAEQVKLRRFLENDSVTVEEMVSSRAMFVAAAATGRHVLAIQDTSEINYQAQSGRKHGLGKVGNGTDAGLFVHPVIAVDAETQECFGLADAQVWCRTKRKAKNYKKLPIEKKESYRWPAILNVNRYSVWAALCGAGAVPVRRIDSGEHQGIRTAP